MAEGLQGGVAQGGVYLHEAPDEVAGGGGEAEPLGGGKVEECLLDLGEDARGGGLRERGAAAEHDVEDDAEGPQVDSAAVSLGLGVGEDLGGDVEGGATEGLHEGGVVEGAGEAKVGELDDAGVVEGEEDVLGLEVAVDDAEVVVEVVDGVEQLLEVELGALLGEELVVADLVEQLLAGELQHHVDVVVGVDDLDDLDDVGVLQLAQRLQDLDLVLQRVAPRGRGGRLLHLLLVQLADGEDVASQVLALPHRREGPPPDLVLQQVPLVEGRLALVVLVLQPLEHKVDLRHVRPVGVRQVQVPVGREHQPAALAHLGLVDERAVRAQVLHHHHVVVQQQHSAVVA